MDKINVKPDENRYARRIQCFTPAKAKGVSWHSGAILCDTLDLSLTGISLLSSEPFPGSGSITVTININKVDFDFTAQVVWHNIFQSSMKYLYGLEFIDFDSKKKSVLITFLDTLKNEWLKNSKSITEKTQLPFLSDKQSFYYDKTVYLSDTNAEGNVYFANYFRWQGEAREAFYKAHFPLDIWQQTGLKLITCEAGMNFKKETTLYNEVQIQVSTAMIKNMSVELLFAYRFKLTGEIIAYGKQKIACADAKGQLIPIPPALKALTYSFLIDDKEYTKYVLK